MVKTESHQKIFGIGLNKTGTTTLNRCGKILGYRTTSCNRDLLKDYALKNDFTQIERVANQFDLFEDWPWALIYKELDLIFPRSKFILTVRKDEHTWINSLKNHSMKTRPTRHCRKFAYGFNYPHRHEQEHLDFYKRHNDNVRDYFKNRPEDFLEICWENGDGFEKLCNFLGKDIPDVPLPHANKGIHNQPNNSRLIANKFLSIFLN